MHKSFYPPHRQLPSPSMSGPDEQVREKRGEKRRIEQIHHPENSRVHSSKKHKPEQETAGFSHSNTTYPIAYWAENSCWPPEVWEHGFKMTDETPGKRKWSSTTTTTTHRSKILERMATHGVHMYNPDLVKEDSKTLCRDYLKGDWQTVQTSVHTPKEFEKVLQRVHSLNEARLRRDIMPWVVPSAEVLFFRGEQGLDYIGDELEAEWYRCATMGGKKPKPDYTAGLLPRAFTNDEIRKLDNYAQPTQPFRFTAELCFPFLMCEVKSCQVGLSEADRQNIHSASIATRAIFQLYRAAYGQSTPQKIEDLYGQILVFTISHNNDQVLLYGHFAVADSTLPDGLEFHRYLIASYNLTAGSGADCLKPYNFVRNIYKSFAPEHLSRIKDAVAQLFGSLERAPSSVADTALDEAGSEQNSQGDVPQSEGSFKKPGQPASVLQNLEITKLREQMDKLLSQLDEQRRDNDRRMEQQRQEMERQRQEMERQRQESRQEIEWQRQDKERQVQQLQEIISLLKVSKS